MSTTSLFVELIVIGASASAWFVLFTISLFGFRWIPSSDWLTLPMIIALLPLVYVMGIVTDRIADAIFDRLWANRLRANWFPTLGEYYIARRQILTRSEHLADVFEYGRSRLRICRGWAFNLILVAIFLNLFVWTHLAAEPWALGVSLFGTFMLLGLALACWYSWRSLANSEYRKIKDQTE